MPIDISSIQTNQTEKETTPKYFNSKLTGMGQKIGILNEDLNPSVIKTLTTQPLSSKTMDSGLAVSYKNGTSKIDVIPFLITPPTLVKENVYLLDKTYKVLDAHNPTTDEPTVKLAVIMRPHSCKLVATPKATNLASSKETVLQYKLMIAEVDVSGDETKCNKVYTHLLTTNPCESTNLLLRTLPIDFHTNKISIKQLDGSKIEYEESLLIEEVKEYLDHYLAYEGIKIESEHWNTETIADEVNHYLDRVVDEDNITHTDKRFIEDTECMFEKLEYYPVPLETYALIYEKAATCFSEERLNAMCHKNTNMLMSDIMRNLKAKKEDSLLPSIPSVDFNTPIKFSDNQLAAVCSTEPLSMVQAGAGTGKSTVILGRIDYMNATGISSDDIMVLSYTNAASDNIINKNKGVKAMTISKMVNNIYNYNFTHQLSNEDTLMNTIDIFYNGDHAHLDTRVQAVANKLKSALYGVRFSRPGASTSLNNIVGRNLSEVIEILDTTNQVTLELQLHICYHLMSKLELPEDIKSKHLIVDEVQDNSMYEFIYLMRYVALSEQTLFIVGDCSQTLYEFRASNPKALNALEQSGVFATNALEINYRSNQEILDMANSILYGIEANKYAKIQLRSNSLASVTGDSFQDKVKLRYKQVARLGNLKDAMISMLCVDMKEYIDDKIAKNEQITIMAHARKDVNRFRELLEQYYPNETCVNIMAEQVFSSVVFSRFIKQLWNTISYAPMGPHILNVIERCIMDNLEMIDKASEKDKEMVIKFLARFRTENVAIVDGFVDEFDKGIITKDELLNNIRSLMLDFEMASNAVRQSMASAKNEAAKDEIENARFVLSTIHGTKGLEFDNVILFIKCNDMSEPDKRMYYVALTRAVKTEFIMAYGTSPSHQLVEDYKAIRDAMGVTNVVDTEAS